MIHHFIQCSKHDGIIVFSIDQGFSANKTKTKLYEKATFSTTDCAVLDSYVRARAQMYVNIYVRNVNDRDKFFKKTRLKINSVCDRESRLFIKSIKTF